MRKHLKRYLPNHEAVHGNRWLRPFRNSLLHPRLWHLNRHSAAGAVAAGMFCGLIPGPLQMLGAAICALVFRVNLPLALLVTLYTNPFTIVPLYILAFSMGEALLGRGEARFTPPPEWSGGDVLGGVAALADWMIALGRPLALGLVVLASCLALAGYLLTRVAWRSYLIHQWRKRRNSLT